MPETLYCPILKWKQGEQKALQKLDYNYKEIIAPIIEVPNIDYDYENEQYKKTIEEHLKDFSKKLEACWGIDKQIYLDLMHLEIDNEKINGKHPLEFVLNQVLNNNQKVIPITGFKWDKEQKNIVKEYNYQTNLGVCIRLFDDDLLKLNDLDNFLKELDVTKESTDLIIDYRDVDPKNIKKDFLSAVQSINMIPELERYRNIIFAATSFPESLGSINQGINLIQRSEWEIMKLILNNKEKIKRIPIYSDYSISYTIIPETDFRVIPLIANIRYTTEQNFIIVKGTDIKKDGSDQFHDMAKELSNFSKFLGEKHCLAENFIIKCANKEINPGNLTTWREFGTYHHIIVVADLLSNLNET